ncbi:MAG: hypothetical protein HQL58_10410 [Magnetococcales bacterium]|nr:hypothetical protein [Magnetococcales bacterium]
MERRGVSSKYNKKSLCYMNIVGINFGHDGSVCVLKDGIVCSYVSRERQTRRKHAVAITNDELDLALSRSGLMLEEIDFFTITSTQSVQLLIGYISDFDIRFEIHDRHKLTENTLYDIYPDIVPQLSPRTNGLDGSSNKDIRDIRWLDQYISSARWDKGATVQEIARIDHTPLLNLVPFRYGFHYPVTVSYRGRTVPGYFINHHIAHAASSFFLSGFDESAIITQDGGVIPDLEEVHSIPYQSGMIFYGSSNTIIPLQPHYLYLGRMYETIGVTLNLDKTGVGSAGKLMGLAPYGRPIFFQNDFVGNAYDYKKRFGIHNMIKVWKYHCLNSLQKLNYSLNSFSKTRYITEQTNADIAASTQKLLEECSIAIAKASYSMLLNSGISTKNLCLGGGSALNCPTNTRLYNETSFKSVFVDPSCSDDGIAIGSSLYLYHHLLHYPIRKGQLPFSQYLGKIYSDNEILVAIQKFDQQVVSSKCSNTASLAADDLAQNRIIAWFEGGSEVGPRALGHRSILANPTYVDNWKRVNMLKGREWWRPFAPSVLEEDMQDWFDGVPGSSPYMLFTARVKSRQLPAITHIDGTARVQTVSPECGQFYRLIKAFKKHTGIPVVLNTSFNGPGEPIVETPQQAISFLARSELLDALYIGEYRLTRAKFCHAGKDQLGRSVATSKNSQDHDLQNFSVPITTLCDLAISKVSEGNHTDAIDLFIVASNHDDASAMFNLAMLYFRNNDFVQALMWLNILRIKVTNIPIENKLNQISSRMTADQIIQAQEMATNWKQYNSTSVIF